MMKADFKKWLTLHRGKTLTMEMIQMIATQHEDEIGSMLYNEGLCLKAWIRVKIFVTQIVKMII